MKVSVTVLAVAVASAAAQQHHHFGHQHLHHKRADAAHQGVDDVVVTSYVLDGRPISAQEVQEGLANGTLTLEPNGAVAAEPAASAATPVSIAHHSKHTKAPVAANAEAGKYNVNAPSSQQSSTSSASSSSSSSSGSSSGGNDDSNFSSDWSQGVDTPFPSGEIDCSTFPSQYGAVAVDYMNLGGWTGIQNPGSILGNAFSGIATIVSGQCSGGDCCGEGMYCSYACPAGYQKAQWPSAQGSTGQSVGGLLCQNGKLQLTNPSLSKNLCITGASEVTVLVQNNLSQNVAVCRTDYPGTEGETIPLNALAGATANLTCPDADAYYNWEGSHTSAQYYVNPAGVSVSDACQWGSPSNDWGNYAPLNLGVGYSNGAAWLSIFQNLPTTSAKLPFQVEIQGDGMSGTCRYSNGQYCGGANYDQCSSTTGCTVSIPSGTATFIFSDA